MSQTLRIKSSRYGLILLSLLFSAAAAEPTVLRVCNDISDPVGLDPHRTFDNKTDDILNQIYEGLVRLNPDGRIIPSLAESWDRLDEKRIRFHLRKGVYFHDGRVLDAAVVRDSIRRQLSTASQATQQISTIEDVIAESPSTVIIQTRQPDAALLHKLAAFARIVSPGHSAPKGAAPLETPPAGTGPFRFMSWERGQRIALEANPHYWRRTSPFQQVIFEFMPSDRQIAGLLDGKIDFLSDIPGTRTLEVARRRELKIVKKQALTTPAFWFTSLRGPLAKTEIRQALNRALDKEAIIRYAALGNGQPIATLSMPGEVGHNDTLRPYPFNAALARTLLKRAGWPADFTIRALVVQQAEREAKIIKSQLQDVGIKMEITVVSIAEGFKIVSEGRLRQYDLTGNLAPDPVDHMYFLAGTCFYSESPMSAGGIPGFDALYDRMMRADGFEEHRLLAEELDRWIYDQAPALFTYQLVRTYGMRADLDIQLQSTGMLDLASFSRTGNGKP